MKLPVVRTRELVPFLGMLLEAGVILLETHWTIRWLGPLPLFGHAGARHGRVIHTRLPGKTGGRCSSIGRTMRL